MSFYLGSRFQTDNTVHRKVVDVEVIVEASSLGRKFQTENVSNSFKKVMISFDLIWLYSVLLSFEISKNKHSVWLIYFIYVHIYVFMSHPMWWYLKRIFIAWKPCRCAVMAPKKRGSPGPQGVGLAKIISEVGPPCSSSCCCCCCCCGGGGGGGGGGGTTSLSPWSYREEESSWKLRTDALLGGNLPCS